MYFTEHVHWFSQNQINILLIVYHLTICSGSSKRMRTRLFPTHGFPSALALVPALVSCLDCASLSGFHLRFCSLEIRKDPRILYLIKLLTTGERFAMAEMKMALAKVLSKFRVEADETTKIEFQKGDQAMMSYTGIHVRMVHR